MVKDLLILICVDITNLLIFCREKASMAHQSASIGPRKEMEDGTFVAINRDKRRSAVSGKLFPGCFSTRM